MSDGEADAVYGYAIAEGDVADVQIITVECQFGQGASELDVMDLSQIFDYAGKHSDEATSGVEKDKAVV